MRLIDACFAVCAPRFAVSIAVRPPAWVIALPLLLFTAHPLAAQVTLAWDPSSSGTVAGYRLYYGTESRIYTDIIDVGTATTYTTTALAGGHTYYFTVTAYDDDDAESAFSNEVSKTLALSGEPTADEFITIEAETMTLTGYRVENHVDASAGQLISRRGAVGAAPGVATVAFPGAAGDYDIIVSYFDENDGQSTLTLTVNGEVMDTWLANADLPSGGPSAVTLTSRVAASGVSLAPGDIIALEGRDHQGEFARLDKVDFVLIGGSL